MDEPRAADCCVGDPYAGYLQLIPREGSSVYSVFRARHLCHSHPWCRCARSEFQTLKLDYRQDDTKLGDCFLGGMIAMLEIAAERVPYSKSPPFAVIFTYTTKLSMALLKWERIMSWLPSSKRKWIHNPCVWLKKKSENKRAGAERNTFSRGRR